MSVKELLGKVLVDVDVNRDKDLIIFKTSDGDTYKMLHIQDCCEDVYIEDICGDVSNLIGSPITMAEEVVNDGNNKYGAYTWTFYKFATLKGYVTIRWYGESNGYYSESVYFLKEEK